MHHPVCHIHLSSHIHRNRVCCGTVVGRYPCPVSIPPHLEQIEPFLHLLELFFTNCCLATRVIHEETLMLSKTVEMFGLPSHSRLFSVSWYPIAQVQKYDPSVLLHISWHPPFIVLHSFTSKVWLIPTNSLTVFNVIAQFELSMATNKWAIKTLLFWVVKVNKWGGAHFSKFNKRQTYKHIWIQHVHTIVTLALSRTYT